MSSQKVKRHTPTAWETKWKMIGRKNSATMIPKQAVRNATSRISRFTRTLVALVSCRSPSWVVLRSQTVAPSRLQHKSSAAIASSDPVKVLKNLKPLPVIMQNLEPFSVKVLEYLEPFPVKVLLTFKYKDAGEHRTFSSKSTV